jgi:hypothetical protein
MMRRTDGVGQPAGHALRARPLWQALPFILIGLALAVAAHAAEQKGFLESVKRHSMVTSTVPPNGDQNPYAIVIAPASAGKIQQGDVLVDNFNDRNNLQGLGTTIVNYSPTTKKLTLFAAIPRNLPQCPGGVGLTTAMTMLKTGWVIVGSLPSQDGTTATKGQGLSDHTRCPGQCGGRHRRAQHQWAMGQYGGDR